MRRVLSQKFFERSAPSVAKDLLGKFLVRQYRGRQLAYMICEVEAYCGLEDKASHASRGKTKRNAVMFGSAGHWYVYFVYGMHWMLNIVTGSEGYPAAVLIRGVAKIDKRGEPHLLQVKKLIMNRGQGAIQIIKGPARLTKQLKIDKRFNGKLTDRKSGLWIEDRGVKSRIKRRELRVKKGPRVGVGYAGPKWSKKPWRFWLERS